MNTNPKRRLDELNIELFPSLDDDTEGTVAVGTGVEIEDDVSVWRSGRGSNIVCDMVCTVSDAVPPASVEEVARVAMGGC